MEDLKQTNTSVDFKRIDAEIDKAGIDELRGLLHTLVEHARYDEWTTVDFSYLDGWFSSPRW